LASTAKGQIRRQERPCLGGDSTSEQSRGRLEGKSRVKYATNMLLNNIVAGWEEKRGPSGGYDEREDWGLPHRCTFVLLKVKNRRKERPKGRGDSHLLS